MKRGGAVIGSGLALFCCTSVVAQLPNPVRLSNLSGITGVAYLGVDFGDGAGEILSGAGDVNGDGAEDFLISAYRATVSEMEYTGRFWLLFGKSARHPSNGIINLDTGISAGTDGYSFVGSRAGDLAGFFVSGAGDVNGDGYDDFLVGAAQEGNSGNLSLVDGPGAAYLVYGPLSLGGATNTELSSLVPNHATRFTGMAAGEALGFCVSGAGDVNGDGYADILVSAAYWNDHRGSAFLIYGGPQFAPGFGSFDVTTVDGLGGVRFNGIHANDGLGRVIQGMGDVNGDGYDDFVLGAWEYDRSGMDNVGAGYLIYGGADLPTTDGIFDVTQLDGTNGVLMLGEQAENRMTRSMGAAGDVNNDGYADFIVVSRLYNDFINAGAGRAYLVYGTPDPIGSGGVLDMLTATSADGVARLDGIEFNAWLFGSYGAGDMNGDGYTDIMIGSPLYDYPGVGEDSGLVAMIYGKSDHLGGVDGRFGLDEIDGTNGVNFRPKAAGDNTGAFVCAAGDNDGDGIPDLLIGAPALYTPGSVHQGATFVVYGVESQPQATTSTYLPPGDTPVQAVGLVGGGRSEIPRSRAWIGFEGGSAGGRSSRQSVTINRSSPALPGTQGDYAAGVWWSISSNRSGWTGAAVSFCYTAAEVQGLNQSKLTIFHRAANGTLTPLETERDPGRRRLTAWTTQLGDFLIGEPGLGDVTTDLWMIR